MWLVLYVLIQILPFVLRKFVAHTQFGNVFLPPIFSLFLVQSLIPSTASRFRNPILIIVLSLTSLCAWYFPSFGIFFLKMSSFASPFVILLEIVVLNILLIKLGDVISEKCHEGESVRFWRILTMVMFVASAGVALFFLFAVSSNSVFSKLLYLLFGVIAHVHNVWHDSGVILTSSFAFLWGTVLMTFDESYLFSEFLSTQFSWIIFGIYEYFAISIFPKHFSGFYLSFLILRSFGIQYGSYNFTAFSFICVVSSVLALQFLK